MLTGLFIVGNTFISFFLRTLSLWHNLLLPSLSLISTISRNSPHFLWSRIVFGSQCPWVTSFFFFYTAMHLMHVGIKVGAYQEVTRCGNQPTQWFSKDYFNCCSYLTPGSYFCPWETIDMVWEPLRGSSGSFYLFWVGASIFYYSLAGVHFPLDFFFF